MKESGDLFLGESKEVGEDAFSLCTLDNGKYEIRFHGKLEELADQLFGGGIMNMIMEGYDVTEEEIEIHVGPEDVYFVVNPKKIPENLK